MLHLSHHAQIKLLKDTGFYFLSLYLTVVRCCAPDTSARALCQHAQLHHTSHTHTHLIYLSTIQPPTSKAPSALCPRCSSRYVGSLMQKKSQCASVNVCPCSCLCSVCFAGVGAERAQRGRDLNLCTVFPL